LSWTVSNEFWHVDVVWELFVEVGVGRARQGRSEQVLLVRCWLEEPVIWRRALPQGSGRRSRPGDVHR
jgi:hypothetical protein